MKIVITGKNSYIGNHIQKWLLDNSEDDCLVEQVDVENEEWTHYDFSGTDAIIHVAGIVHKPKLKDELVYTRVNVDLPFKIAIMAKEFGVKQFVFFSSMAVYGVDKTLKPNIITDETPILPKSLYGKSKYQAEIRLLGLADENFIVSIVRPPSVYGYGCKGNYINGFLKLTNLSIPFPYAYDNIKQSMIYIDNLCEAVRIILTGQICGIICPRDSEAVSSLDIVRAISKAEGKTKKFSKFLGIIVKVFRFLPVVKKVFGGIEYSKVSDLESNYCIVNFEEGIFRTINNEETV